MGNSRRKRKGANASATGEGTWTNLLGDLCLEMGGRQEDSAPNKEGLLAGLPFWLKVVRHAPLDPIERPRALHYAYKASLVAEKKERAALLRGELESRFAGSRWTKAL